MTRVLLLTMSLGPGGAEDQVVWLSIELRRRGWEPAVVSLLPLSTREGELRDAGVAAYSLGMGPGKPDPRGLIRLTGILCRFRPRILHSHMFHANCMARLARLICPVPVVISTLHSAAEAPRNTNAPGTAPGAPHSVLRGVRLRDLVYRLTDCMGDAVVAVSSAVAERHASSYAAARSKLSVIPNAVDTGVFRPDEERRARVRGELGLGSQFVWLAAGRLFWKKDFGTLLRAVSGRPKSKLLIAGEGPQEAELKKLAAALPLNARFLGRVADMPALMNAADALVLSSVVEGLPMVLLEAAASGLPAVATDVGGVREAITDGRTGYLVPAGDAALLRNAMSRIEALAPAERAAMSAAARAGVARFDAAAIAAQWERLYAGLLENSPWT